MIINKTILGVAPLRTSLLFVGAIMVMLFTLIKPEASQGLGFISRFVYWSLHIGIGLLAIIVSSYTVRFWPTQKLSTLMLVTLTGIGGAIIASPFYYLTGKIYPCPTPNHWLHIFGHQGWWQGIIAVFIESLPIMLFAWYAVNLPLLLNKPQVHHPQPEPETSDNDLEALKRQRIIQSLYSNLPEALGKDIVAISSDLHYLNVHTTLGKTLILGSLKEYVDAFQEVGMLVHRSQWVVKAHIVKVYITGDESYCLMSNGLKAPVSRSKRKIVKNYFSQDTQITKQKNNIHLVKSA